MDSTDNGEKENKAGERDLIAERIETESAIDNFATAGEPESSGGIDQLGSRELLAAEDAAAGGDLGTYGDMLREYLRDQRHWIGPAQRPLVFHLLKIGQQLDANPGAPASLSSAYLQAFRRLDLQRPGNKEPAGAGGDLPGQGSIFDELDD